MKDENTKILIALILKSENGVFLERHESGKFSLPSRFLGRDEQPEEVVGQLAHNLGIADNDIANKKHSFRNLSIDTETRNNIVVILTTYNLAGNNLSDSSLIEVNVKNLERTRLDAITKTVLESEGIYRMNADDVASVNLERGALDMDKKDSEGDADEHKNVQIFSDGGSRGNPGPSACGFVIEDENGAEIYRGGEYLGVTTNNQAEYHGVRLALEKAVSLGARGVDLKGDSLLVINQMNGIYKVKNKDLWPIYERIKELVTKFDKVTFTHVYREHNRGADAMVNEILDKHAENIQN